MTNDFTYLNNGSIVKDLFFKHGGEKEMRGSNFHACTLNYGLSV